MYRLMQLCVLGILLMFSRESFAGPFRGIEKEAVPKGISLIGNPDDDKPSGILAMFEFSRDLTQAEQIRLVARLIIYHYSFTGEIKPDWLFVAAYTTPRKSVSVMIDLREDEVIITEEWEENRNDKKYRCKIWHGNALGTVTYLLQGTSSPNRETHYGRDIDKHYQARRILRMQQQKHLKDL